MSRIETVCPKCNHQMSEGMEQLFRSVDPGELYVCQGCACWLQFGSDLKLYPADPETPEYRAFARVMKIATLVVSSKGKN